MTKFQLIVKFWHSHPALLYGLALLLGFYASFQKEILLVIPLLALWIPFIVVAQANRQFWMPLLLSFSLFCSAWIYADIYYIFPKTSSTGIAGKAHLSIESIRLQSSFFGKRWIYNCQVKNFFPDDTPQVSIARHAKCILSVPYKTEIIRPLADREYIVEGKLTENENGTLVLKIDSQKPWHIVKGSWSLTEKRYAWKKFAAAWINTNFKTPLSASFLSVLATGEFDDQWLRNEFARFGLQHIMAISGFHFAILACLLSLIFRLFLSRSQSAWLLLICLAGYALFLGSNPSIMRAWLMCSIVFIGQLIERNAVSLNSLGLALMGVLMIDPLFCQTIGFQFSFLVTGAILLGFSPLDKCLGRILTKRSLSEIVEMNHWNQHGYCVLAFLRQGLSLLIVVNLFAIPLTLFYFHQFPLMSLFYNLFFPLLITGSMVLMILGMLTAWIPFLGFLLNNLNDRYTKIVLQLTYGMPGFLDYYVKWNHFDKGWLIGYLTLILLIFILIRESKGLFEGYDDDALLL
jgi:competence protein ComEC